MALGVLLLAAVPAVALDNATELMMLQNRMQRQQFNQQQQQFRIEDRQQPVPPEVRRPQVRSLGTDCRTEVFGNSYVKRCR